MLFNRGNLLTLKLFLHYELRIMLSCFCSSVSLFKKKIFWKSLVKKSLYIHRADFFFRHVCFKNESFVPWRGTTYHHNNIYFASRCCALHLSSTHIVVNTYLSDFFPPKVIIFKKFYSKLNNNFKKKITEEPLRVSRTA